MVFIALVSVLFFTYLIVLMGQKVNREVRWLAMLCPLCLPSIPALCFFKLKMRNTDFVMLLTAVAPAIIYLLLFLFWKPTEKSPQDDILDDKF
jgi:hypothetical protein